MTPAERSLRAKVAAHTRWARTDDRVDATSAARAAFADRFAKQVDPNGTLPPAERSRRAASLRSAYYADLARRSAKARRQRKAA